MTGIRTLVFLGSAREGRMGDRIVSLVAKQLQAREHIVEVIDPLEVGSDGFVHQPLHFRRDPATAPEWMTMVNNKIKSADALVVVTPEYNCSISPALTSLMDQFPPASYRHKPASIVCYSMGPFGGVRAAAFTRPFLSELGVVSLPHVAVVPQIQDKFDAEGECTDERVRKNVEKLVSELSWYANAIKSKIDEEGAPN